MPDNLLLKATDAEIAESKELLCKIGEVLAPGDGIANPKSRAMALWSAQMAVYEVGMEGFSFHLWMQHAAQAYGNLREGIDDAG